MLYFTIFCYNSLWQKIWVCWCVGQWPIFYAKKIVMQKLNTVTGRLWTHSGSESQGCQLSGRHWIPQNSFTMAILLMVVVLGCTKEYVSYIVIPRTTFEVHTVMFPNGINIDTKQKAVYSEVCSTSAQHRAQISLQIDFFSTTKHVFFFWAWEVVGSSRYWQFWMSGPLGCPNHTYIVPTWNMRAIWEGLRGL